MHNIGSLWMVLASLGFALMGYFVKICGNYLDFQEIVFWRMAISVMILLLFASVKGYSIKTPHLKGHITRGVVGTASLVLYFYLIVRLPLATAVTLSYTSVIWFIILSIFILKQRVSLMVLLSAVVGFIGIGFLLQPTFSSGQMGDTLVGVLVGTLSALAYIQVKELTLLKEPEWKIVFYFSLIGAIATGVWSLFTGFNAISLESIGFIIAMALSSLVGQVCMTLSYSKGNLFVSSILSYLTIVFSFLIGFFVLGDQLTSKEALGILLVLVSGIMSRIFTRTKQQKIIKKEKV